MKNTGDGGLTPVVVWGAGAMGGCIGASLVRAGTDVLFVDREEDHVTAMNHSGLHITGPVEEFRVRVRAMTPPEVEGRFPLCLLCVKSHHTKEALDQLRQNVYESKTFERIISKAKLVPKEG